MQPTSATGTAQQLVALAGQMAAVRAGDLKSDAHVRWLLSPGSRVEDYRRTTMTPLGDGLLNANGRTLVALPVTPRQLVLKVCALACRARPAVACIHSSCMPAQCMGRAGMRCVQGAPATQAGV